MIDLIVSSNSLEELCKGFVFSELAGGMCRGAHVFSINTESDLVLEAGYGQGHALVEEKISGWLQGPIAMSVRTKQSVFEHNDDKPVLSVPFTRNAMPNACLLLVFDESVTSPPLPMGILPLLSKTGGFFVENKPKTFSAARGVKSFGSPQLTQRQKTILKGIDAGMTNSLIGQEVNLSESSVRQETIRIYRILEAQGRMDAVVKAKNLGIIQ